MSLARIKIAPEFTVIDGKYNKGGRCSFEDMEEKTINFIKGNVTDCERRRIFQYLEQWLNDKDTERTLTMNE
jgi:hypothetical protein